jgi:hypothetical protein
LKLLQDKIQWKLTDLWGWPKHNRESRDVPNVLGFLITIYIVGVTGIKYSHLGPELTGVWCQGCSATKKSVVELEWVIEIASTSMGWIE